MIPWSLLHTISATLLALTLGPALSSSALDRCIGEDFEGYSCKKNLACLPKEKVCDGEVHCPDGSDEEEGCRQFGDTDCKSWYGKRHVLCNSTESVCTLPHLVDNCRACSPRGFWRCDDGFCIKVSKVQNGVEDCRDGSDEWHVISPWLPISLCIITGILVFLVSILAVVLFFKILGQHGWLRISESHKEKCLEIQKRLMDRKAKPFTI